MYRPLLAILVFLLSFGVVAADNAKKTKPLTKSQQAAAEKAAKQTAADNAAAEKKAVEEALAKYDDLKDEYRQAAIDNFKDILEWQKHNPFIHYQHQERLAAILKNDGPIYPSLIAGKKTGKLSIGKWGTLTSIPIMQVVSNEKALCGSDLVYFVEGIDTTNIVDDQTISFNGVYVVSGTETYDTKLGTKKVFVITKFNPKKEVLK